MANASGFNPLDIIGSLAALFAGQNAAPSYGSPSALYGAPSYTSPSALYGNGPYADQLAGNAPSLLAAAGIGRGTIGATPVAPAPRGTRTTQSASPFPGYMSQAQQLALATKEALAQIQPMLDEYHYQQQQAMDYANAQAAVARARGDALAQINAKIGPQISQAYGDAANATANYAKGYSADTQNSVNADAAANAATLAKVSGGVGATPAPANIADVIFGTSGKIPADALQQQGAAFRSAADFLPATARGLGEQDATTALSQGYLQNQNLQHQIDAVLKQSPNLTTSALSQIQKDQMDLYDRAHKNDITPYQRATLELSAAKYKQGQQLSPYQRAQLKLGQQRIDQGNTKQIFDQLNKMSTQSGTMWVLGKNGKPVDSGRPLPATIRDARQQAKDLSIQYGTVFRLDARGRVFQPLGKDGQPIPTVAGQSAASAASARTQTQLLRSADSLTRGTGIVYQPTPDGKGVAPMLDDKGNVIQTPQGAASSANIQALRMAEADHLSKQTGVLHQVNPDGSITAVTGPKGAPVKTASQASADRKFALDRNKYLAALGKDKRTALNQLASQTGLVWQYDANGTPTPVQSNGKPLLTASERHRRASEQQGQARINQGNTRITDAEQAHQDTVDAAAAQQSAARAAALEKSGVVYLPIKTPKGWKEVPQFTPSGKPLLTTEGRNALKRAGGSRPIDQKTIGLLKGDASTIASQAHDGFTDAAGVKHPPITYDQALQEMAKGGKHGQIPASIAVNALNAVYPEGTTPDSRPFSPKTLTSNPQKAGITVYVRMAGVEDKVIALDQNQDFVGMIQKGDPGFARVKAKAKLWDGVPGHLPGEHLK